jgi:3,4-dihydroxy 2-butanone 4-phosphate synthase / GTP cyclohydrolase II
VSDPTAAVRQAIDAVAAGGIVVISDNADRENEADLIMAADATSAAEAAFMLRHTSGIVCVALSGERLAELRLPQMVSENSDLNRTAFTVSVDCRWDTTTGVSAPDRARTINALADTSSTADDFRRPGHVFPLRAREGGVLKRAGHTEAALDLVRLAGRAPAGVLCELMNDDGTMMRGPAVRRFAERHGLAMLSIDDLIRYRTATETLVERIATATMPTRFGDFTAHVFRSALDGAEHVALSMGTVGGPEPLLVRVHSECLTGDSLGSLRCDCGDQRDMALRTIAREGRGVLVYLRGHEGRGIGLGHKLRAYELQDRGSDTVEANLELGLPIDSREYGIGAQILAQLGARRLRLLTNNPAKYTGLAGYGLEVVDRVPLQPAPRSQNIAYLRTKQQRLGHFLSLGEATADQAHDHLDVAQGEAAWP